MNLREAVSERMVFGLIILAGWLALLAIVIFHGVDGPVRDLVIAALGALASQAGQIVQSVFKTDRVDRQNAEATADLARAAANATGTGNGNGAPAQ